jgi:hypothetical protein
MRPDRLFLSCLVSFCYVTIPLSVPSLSTLGRRWLGPEGKHVLCWSILMAWPTIYEISDTGVIKPPLLRAFRIFSIADTVLMNVAIHTASFVIISEIPMDAFLSGEQTGEQNCTLVACPSTQFLIRAEGVIDLVYLQIIHFLRYETILPIWLLTKNLKPREPHKGSRMIHSPFGGLGYSVRNILWCRFVSLWRTCDQNCTL